MMHGQKNIKKEGGISFPPRSGVRCSVFNVQCSLFNVQCSLFSVHCSVFTVQCSLFNVQCSLFLFAQNSHVGLPSRILAKSVNK